MANGARRDGEHAAACGAIAVSKLESRLDKIRETQAWYEAGPDALANLRRVALEVASEQPAAVPKVCEALVKALALGMRRSRLGAKGESNGSERDPRGDCIRLEGNDWEGRAQLKARCQEILRRYPENVRLDETDCAFMRALLAHHPRGQEKLNGCHAMVVGVHPVHAARCFYVLRSSGSEDFSYVRCVDNLPTVEVMTQRQICDALCSVLRLHPASCEHVAQVIEENFPSYRGRDGAVVERHRNWTNSILELCGRMPALTEFLLRVLVRRMIEIDAAILKMESDILPEDALGAGDDSTLLMSAEDKDEKQSQLNIMAHILDAKMMMAFEFLQRNLDARANVGDGENRLIFSLMEIFESIVLLTHQARCVQFLWFYLASLRPAWTETFLSLLLRTAFSPNLAMPKRLISLAYLASFVARAKFLNMNFILRTAQYVATLARELLQSAEGHFAAERTSHPQCVLLLYAVQALCYILCFHMEDFAKPECEGSAGRSALHVLLYEGRADVGAEAFGPVLESPANPIARINKQVAEQFLHCLRPHMPAVAGALGQRLAQFSADQSRQFCQGEQAGLEIFFPFDPYRLRHSSMFVLSIYRDWVDDEESNADPADAAGADGFAKAIVTGPAHRRSLAPSEADEMDSDMSDADFTDAQHAHERFVPSIKPSPAFQPRGSTDMADIMSPLCMPMGAVDEDDGFALPTASMPLDADPSTMLYTLMNSAAYRAGNQYPSDGAAVAT